mmetsp:Transcript_26448/g.103047  ORF Transcript_26448/g.103047 Transcript_26448/m.103047 type:complete len:120 (-) Transcript_26448:2066-2425(-)
MEGRELRNRFLFESSLALKHEAPSLSRYLSRRHQQRLPEAPDLLRCGRCSTILVGSRARVRKGRAVRVCEGCGNIERSIRKSCPKEERFKSPIELANKQGKKKQASDKPTKLSSSFLFE